VAVQLARRPAEVAPGTLVAGLVPPPLFAEVSFDSYRPDPNEPSQSQAVTRLREFAASLNQPAGRSGLFRRASVPSGPTGVYLDGGFGVGKTHLLASIWHAAPAPKAYATFVELTQLAGALGFARLVEALAPMRLLAIDEFELDDPGDTVLVSTLLARLAEQGVRLAATSNTLPDRLGEDRFAAEDFLREIQALAARFETVHIDGPDYRHRGLPSAPQPYEDGALVARAESLPGASLDDFDALIGRLAALHPSRYGALVDGISAVYVHGARPAPDQSVALRLVVLADRLYDRQIPFAVSGTAVDQLFDAGMLAGGYRKKYRRAISRLAALCRLEAKRDGEEEDGHGTHR
jgi:cell division protein ZapE